MACARAFSTQQLMPIRSARSRRAVSLVAVVAAASAPSVAAAGGNVPGTVNDNVLGPCPEGNLRADSEAFGRIVSFGFA